MTAFRDIKRDMRRDLHTVLQVSALYLRTPLSEPLAVTVRVRPAFNKTGEVQGARTYPAQMQNESDTIRFDLTQLPRSPERGAIVSVAQGEAYKIDNMLAPDDQFITGEVTRMGATEAAGLPVPAVDA